MFSHRWIKLMILILLSFVLYFVDLSCPHFRVLVESVMHIDWGIWSMRILALVSFWELVFIKLLLLKSNFRKKVLLGLLLEQNLSVIELSLGSKVSSFFGLRSTPLMLLMLLRIYLLLILLGQLFLSLFLLLHVLSQSLKYLSSLLRLRPLSRLLLSLDGLFPLMILFLYDLLSRL